MRRAAQEPQRASARFMPATMRSSCGSSGRVREGAVVVGRGQEHVAPLARLGGEGAELLDHPRRVLLVVRLRIVEPRLQLAPGLRRRRAVRAPRPRRRAWRSASGKRSAGAWARARSSMALQRLPMTRPLGLRRRGSARRARAAAPARGCSPRRAGAPPCTRRASTPSPKTSARASTSPPSICSGAMCAGLPSTCPVDVTPCASSSLAMPKSVSLTTTRSPLGARRRPLAARSRAGGARAARSRA